jgi:hypothetical protein
MKSYLNLVLLSLLLHTTSCKNSNEYSLPASLQLNGKIKSITETSYGVDSRFGDPCQSERQCIAMHFGMPCESRTIVFDNKGNISRVVSDNSIQQYATYSKSNEILEELMLDREGTLDYRVYNGEPIELPLGIKSNNYCFKPIYNKRNHLLEYLANSQELEENWVNEPCSFRDTIVIIKRTGILGEEFYKAYTFDINGEFLYEFDDFVPHRNYERSYYVESYYDNGKPKLVSERGFKKRFYYNNLGETTQTETYKNNGDLVHRTTYCFNKDEKCLEEKFVLFNDGNREEALYKYYFSPEGKITKKKWWYSDKYGTYSSNFSYNDKQQICQINDYNIIRNKNGLIDSICIDNWERRETYKYEYHDFSKAYIKSLCDTDFSEYTNVETEYDEYHNWIKKVCYIGDEVAVYYERKIVYK